MAVAGLLWLAVFGVALAIVLTEAVRLLAKRVVWRLHANRPGKPG